MKWTEEAGASWRDITPTGTVQVDVAFFLDTRHGWLGVGDRGDLSHLADITICRTADAGATWLKSAAETRIRDCACPTSIHFVDTRLGSLTYLPEGPLNSGGAFRTTDGGATWTPLMIPIRGALRFVSARDGWIAPGVNERFLYATRDGGSSWQRGTPPLDPTATVTLPEFFGAHAVLASRIQRDPPDDEWIFYTTDDAGRTWSPASRLRDPQPGSGPSVYPIAILDRLTWIVIAAHGSRLQWTDNGGSTWHSDPAVGLPATPLALRPGEAALRFVDHRLGWARVQWGQCTGAGSDCRQYASLYATADGGRTWSLLRP